MNPIPDDELISAYLDGELSEGDRARVEAMLTEQPEARQLLEELRALRGGFEGLTRHHLDEDFVDRVMRTAEREMLAGDPANVRWEHVEGEPIEMRLASVERRHHEQEARATAASQDVWRRLRRPLAWAGLALAAGLLLMMLDRNPQAPRPMGQVAEAPREPNPGNTAFRAAGGQERGKAARDIVPAEPKSALGVENREDQPAPNASLDERLETMQRPAAGPNAIRSLRGGPDSAAAKSGAKPGTANGRGVNAADRELDSAVPAPMQRFDQRFLEENEGKTASLVYDVERLEDGKLVAEPLDEKMLIVWCDVDKNVADRPEFRQLLASNGIAWQPNTPAETAEEKSRLGDRAPNLAQTARPKGNASLSLESASGQKPRENAATAQEAPPAANEPKEEASARYGTSRDLQRAQIVSDALNRADSDYVLVEAPAEQLKGVLTEIDRRPDLFLSVNVEPASAAPDQRAYAAYSRGRRATTKQLAEQSEQRTPAFEKAAAGGKATFGADMQAESQQSLGRAQRVVVLPQVQQNLSDEYGRGVQGGLGGRADKLERERLLSKKAGAGEEKAAKDEAKKEESGKRKEDDEKEDAADRKSLLADKAAPASEPVEPTGAPRRSGAANYQQALLIFRRIPSDTTSQPPAGPPASKPGK